MVHDHVASIVDAFERKSNRVLESSRVKSQEYQSLESELLKMITEYNGGCSESLERTEVRTKTDVQSEDPPLFIFGTARWHYIMPPAPHNEIPSLFLVFL